MIYYLVSIHFRIETFYYQFKMKAYTYIIVVFVILNIFNFAFWIKVKDPYIWTYLKYEINNRWTSILKEKIQCSEWLIVNDLFDFLTEKWFFDKNDLWLWKYFSVLVDFSKNDNTNNFKTKSIFPYVNDDFIKNGKWLNILCSWDNYLYLDWWFIVKWTIEIQNWNSFTFYDEDLKRSNINYDKVYLKLDDDVDLGDFPYVDDWRIFIWCVQNGSFSNELNFIKPEIIWNSIRYSLKTKFLMSNKVVDWEVIWDDYFNQNIMKYHGWKKALIKFYIDPWFIPRYAYFPCQNSWMLKYEILWE